MIKTKQTLIKRQKVEEEEEDGIDDDDRRNEGKYAEIKMEKENIVSNL